MTMGIVMSCSSCRHSCCDLRDHTLENLLQLQLRWTTEKEKYLTRKSTMRKINKSVKYIQEGRGSECLIRAIEKVFL